MVEDCILESISAKAMINSLFGALFFTGRTVVPIKINQTIAMKYDNIS